MADSQNPTTKTDVQVDPEEVNGSDAGSRSGDYYYDDSTGYEIYDGRDEESEEADCEAGPSRHSDEVPLEMRNAPV